MEKHSQKLGHQSFTNKTGKGQQVDWSTLPIVLWCFFLQYNLWGLTFLTLAICLTSLPTGHEGITCCSIKYVGSCNNAKDCIHSRLQTPFAQSGWMNLQKCMRLKDHISVPHKDISVGYMSNSSSDHTWYQARLFSGLPSQNLGCTCCSHLWTARCRTAVTIAWWMKTCTHRFLQCNNTQLSDCQRQ